MCAARREQLRCSYPERDAQALVEEHDEHLDTRWFELALADDIHEYLTSA